MNALLLSNLFSFFFFFSDFWLDISKCQAEGKVTNELSVCSVFPKAHVQYLSSVIHKSKQRMKRKYGVQYVLDTIRTYYR